jgi:adenylate cyclase, class 2
MRLNELEIKLQILAEEHFLKLSNQCHQLFGPPQSHILQLDEYYDTSDEQLKKQDLVVRIRTSGNKKTIALKSPRMELPSGMTNRIELEFVAAEGENVQDQFLKQGLMTNEAAEKERWTFVHEQCEIVLDKLPFIGFFIEIEGPSEEAIQGIIKLLNLSSCPIIRQNYGELMIAKFRELNMPLTKICATFANEIEFNKS